MPSRSAPFPRDSTSPSRAKASAPARSSTSPERCSPRPCGIFHVTIITKPGSVSNPLAFTVANPTSVVVTTIAPASATAGDASPIALTVTGSGFVPTSVVRFNGASLTTTFTSSTQLERRGRREPARVIRSEGSAGHRCRHEQRQRRREQRRQPSVRLPVRRLRLRSGAVLPGLILHPGRHLRRLPGAVGAARPHAVIALHVVPRGPARVLTATRSRSGSRCFGGGAGCRHIRRTDLSPPRKVRSAGNPEAPCRTSPHGTVRMVRA
jgi:hypothetical protein